MRKTVIEAISLTVLATVLAFGVNSLSPKGISLVGTWYDNRDKIELDEPPSYDATTDTLLTMNQAFNLWQNSGIFIDTREPDEYEEGHIPGALNLPFEQWDDYWYLVEPYLDVDSELILYCGGLDCELSLFAARELQIIGYPNSYIFFGGYHKWVKARMPVEIGCGDEMEILEHAP